MSRVLALLVAVGLVWGAVQVQSRREGGSDDRSDATGIVVCVTELEAVCDELEEATGDDLELRVEAAGVTLESLTEDESPGIDAWLTLQPWPQMARDRREFGGLAELLGEDSDSLGHSPLVIAAWEERAEVLAQACDTVTWSCIGEAAGGTWADIGGEEAWGPLKPGFADPTRTAVGLITLHQAVASQLGNAEYGTRDLEGDPFFGWFTTLGRAVNDSLRGPGSPLDTMVLAGRGRYDLVGAVQADLLTLLQRAGERTAGIETLPGEPPVTAEVVAVAVAPDGATAERLADDVPDLLAEHGWDAGPAPQGSIPAPGALEALRARWSEVVP